MGEKIAEEGFMKELKEIASIVFSAAMFMVVVAAWLITKAAKVLWR